MSCVKEDGSCMEDTDESGSGESGSGDFGSGDFGPGDDYHIICHEGTVSDHLFHQQLIIIHMIIINDMSGNVSELMFNVVLVIPFSSYQ